MLWNANVLGTFRACHWRKYDPKAPHEEFNLCMKILSRYRKSPFLNMGVLGKHWVLLVWTQIEAGRTMKTPRWARRSLSLTWLMSFLLVVHNRGNIFSWCFYFYFLNRDFSCLLFVQWVCTHTTVRTKNSNAYMLNGSDLQAHRVINHVKHSPAVTRFAKSHTACRSFLGQEVMNVNERRQMDADKNKEADVGRRRAEEEGLWALVGQRCHQKKRKCALVWGGREALEIPNSVLQ